MFFKLIDTTVKGGGVIFLVSFKMLTLDNLKQSISIWHQLKGLLDTSALLIVNQQGPLIFLSNSNSSRKLLLVPNTRENVFPEVSSAKAGYFV